MSEFSLFNAADECLAPYISARSFDESLILNLLFQQRILLHEAYFFNSSLVADHINRACGAPSLFEFAARRGLIIPAFRDKNSIALEQAYQAMKREGVYGRSYDLLSPAMQPLRDRLVASVDIGLQKVRPFYWPTRDEEGESLGDGYSRVIRRLLQQDEPPAYVRHDEKRAQLFDRVWELSKRWRYDCIEQAAARTQQKGAKGLQRFEIFCTLGWLVGIPQHNTTISVADILMRCEDEEEKLAMEIFLKWVTQCHHLNQAQTFGTAINFPVYNMEQDFIVDSLLRSPADLPPPPSEGFRCEVKLPPVDVMLKAGAADVVSIRDDLGCGYLAALTRWQNGPTDENREAAISSLKDYCDQICARYERGILQTLLVDYIKGKTSPIKMMRDAGVTLTGKAIPLLGTFVNVAQSACVFYRFTRSSKLKSRLNPKTRELEVTLPC